MRGTVHVVGAGLAGLSAAVRLAVAGRRIVLYEASRAAGGRCRSYHDAGLGLTIDNGNHLLLSGNRSALDYVALVSGNAALDGSPDAAFDFADVRTGERWQLRPNTGRVPWWVLTPSRRVPGSRVRDYLQPLAILRAPHDAAIGEVMRCDGPLWERLWHPVLLAALNTAPETATAGLAATILRETLGAGGSACRPIVATGGLSAAFVEPALAMLRRCGGTIRFGTRVRAIGTEGERVRALDTSDGAVTVQEGDNVVLALPAPVAADLLPGLTVPTEFRAIVNAHFRVVPPPGTPLLLGLVGSLSEWLFCYPDRLSVTISGADRLLDTSREELAAQIWREVAAVTGLASEPMPPWQIVKERRATFAATPAMEKLRPAATTIWKNLVLAGDWTDTGLPATIEGAIRSGEKAASLLQRSDGLATRRVPEVQT